MTQAYTPTTTAEAVRLLSDPELQATPVAGCTDLMVVDAATGRTHAGVVDLQRIPELHGIRLTDGKDELDLGAACTFAQIRRDPLVLEHLPVLAEVAAVIGGWQIQNRATLGGNIANASPAGDSLPVLLALGAELVIAGPRGERGLPYDQVHVGYRRTALERGELIVRVRVPIRTRDTIHLFRKVGTREAQAISKVVVAAAARRVESRLRRIRFAAGSVAPTPVRLKAAEAVCEGGRPELELAERAGRAARGEVRPIDHVRSTAADRSFVLGRVVRRMVLQMAERPPGAG